jgi:hypothetical protein
LEGALEVLGARTPHFDNHESISSGADRIAGTALRDDRPYKPGEIP